MEKKIDKTFSRAMNEINSLQKAFKAGGKFEKAVSDIGGDIAWFNEVNEAFDNLYDALEEAHMVNHDKVNVNGGSIAMGHPLGATGAMILGTLLDELERQDKTMGLATLCVASGMGAATIIERI
jgi:acetyl-CoA C-acetyltransferase